MMGNSGQIVTSKSLTLGTGMYNMFVIRSGKTSQKNPPRRIFIVLYSILCTSTCDNRGRLVNKNVSTMHRIKVKVKLAAQMKLLFA